MPIARRALDIEASDIEVAFDRRERHAERRRDTLEIAISWPLLGG
jgi:hypothetical protein